jgi:uridine kinase
VPTGLDGTDVPIVTVVRSRLLTDVCDDIESLVGGGPDRMAIVGIDGIDGAGKSTFADELARTLTRRGRSVVRASIDSFHKPRATRWSRGRSSPIGFYLDSHDLDALHMYLLAPLRSGEPFCTAAFDEPSDKPVEQVWTAQIAGGIVLFDGVFLHRRELVDAWDASIWLEADVRVTAERIDRSIAHCPLDGALALVHLAKWWARLDRYVTGQRLYIADVDPAARADIVIDNNDLAAPTIRRRH